MASYLSVGLVRSDYNSNTVSADSMLCSHYHITRNLDTLRVVIKELNYRAHSGHTFLKQLIAFARSAAAAFALVLSACSDCFQ